MRPVGFLAALFARKMADRLHADKDDPTRVARKHKRYLKTRVRRRMALASRRGNRS